jgi:hypothetical protein
MTCVIDFDPQAHTYKVDGEHYPSVTQVLTSAGLIDTTWYTPEACQLGTYVHQALHLMDTGELDEATLDPALRPYLDGWFKFLTDSRAEVMAMEYPVANTCHRYAGTLDRWLLWNGDVIVDIKTGAAEPWHALQTALYARCLKVNARRACVYLPGDGSYKAVAHTNPNDESVGLAAVALHHWKTNNGVK